MRILEDLQVDKKSFGELGISYEEKAFYDILVKVRDDHNFVFADEKCIDLSKKIKELADDKPQFADCLPATTLRTN
jgi:type I restriction enzyme R subunit